MNVFIQHVTQMSDGIELVYRLKMNLNVIYMTIKDSQENIKKDTSENL